MKNIFKITLGFILITILFNCNNDDNLPNYDSQLIGNWELRKINTMEGGIIEVNDNQVIWKFNPNGKLLVNNNLEDSMRLSSGEYNFHSETYNHEILNQTVSSILINNQREGQFYKITNDTLIVDYGSYLDAPIYIFVR